MNILRSWTIFIACLIYIWRIISEILCPIYQWMILESLIYNNIMNWKKKKIKAYIFVLYILLNEEYIYKDHKRSTWYVFFLLYFFFLSLWPTRSCKIAYPLFPIKLFWSVKRLLNSGRIYISGSIFPLNYLTS